MVFAGNRTISYIIVLMSLLQEEVSRFLEAWMRVRQVVQAANFNHFRRAGLSATQFMSLNVIPQDGLTLAEIARRLNLSAASLKKTIDSLSERGLVVRKPRANDRRKITIVSTAAGKRLQNSASGEFQTFIAGIFGDMSHQERRGLVTGLEQFLQIAEQHAQEQQTSATRRAVGAARGKHSTRQSR